MSRYIEAARKLPTSEHAHFAGSLISLLLVYPLGEPLSEHELEVLRLIVAGCSNREIADRLVIVVSAA